MIIQLQLFADKELLERNRSQVKRFLEWRKHINDEVDEQEEYYDESVFDSKVINSLAEKFDV